MVIRKKYIESLFYAIISELNPNNEKRSKLYINLCNAINSEGFDFTFSEIKFDNETSYDYIISEYNNCFENKQNPFSRNFNIIREIASGGFGKVFEVESLLDLNKYAIKKTYPKSEIMNYNILSN
jgi:hypothetical protein